MSQRKYYNGYQFKTLDNHTVTIINYINSHNITIQFENGIQRLVDCKHLTRISKYKMPQTQSNGNDNSSCYRTWSSLLNRSLYHNTNKSCYDDIILCDEWKVYENFKKWYDEHYYEIEGEEVELDKDLLIKGNKIYSPQTCLFVPQYINNILVNKSKQTITHRKTPKNQSPIDNDILPVGVTWCNDKKKYRASINYHGKVKNLGRYNTIQEAFNTYKQAKEQYIKDVAEQYKPYIPQVLYDILINYKIDIND